MKKVILNSYFDKGLGRTVEAGEILDIDQDRIEVLASIGVNVKECDDDLDDESNDDYDDSEEEQLISDYKNDRNIVSLLKADELKVLCKAFELNYTNVADAKEALKILTIG